MSRLVSPLVAAALLGLAACSGAGDRGGEIQLSLTGRSYSSGAVYRLRNAQLTIAPAGIVLSTEDDPDRESITAELDAGFYTLDISDGWRLERITDGVAEPVFAILQSPDPLTFDVFAGQVTPVRLSFRADGQDVVTGPGAIDIGIDVDDHSHAADAGTVDQVDAAPVEIDAGTGTIDAGSPDIDAAGPDIDAASPDIDAAGPDIDAASPDIDAGTPVVDASPAPSHLQYVANHFELPTTASAFAADIDGNGIAENRLATILNAVRSQLGIGLDLQDSLDSGVARGRRILLADLELAGAGQATLRTFGGASANPAPCTDANDTVCGQHLQGGASFQIAASPAPGAVPGVFTGSRFIGGPGSLTLQLPIGVLGLSLPLQSARVDVGATGAGTLGGVVAGAISRQTIDSQLVPFFYQLFARLAIDDCGGGGTPPSCGCAAGSTGAQLLALFDYAPQDCVIRFDEFRDSALTRTLFAPDLDIAPVDGANDSMSVGVGVSAVFASFPQP